jgi:asparagine synthase (glutamine-hydrolysing)
MCGIAGVFSPAGAPVAAAELRAMAAAMTWRGPDDEGYLLESRDGRRAVIGGPDTPAEAFDAGLPYAPSREAAALAAAGAAVADAWLGLAFRRLSILDLAPSGHQPMCDPSGRYWLVFNGEVYNYVELREELAARGHRFASSGDAAVILAAYAEWGEACLQRLNGMWGLALWDAAERRLFLARDRFGVKPLYYQWDGARLRFASELKPLVMDRPRRAEARCVHDLVAWDWVDHEPETFFAGTLRLPPAHALTATGDGLRVWRWWDLAESAARLAADSPYGEAAAVEGFRERFDDAVRIRLRSDVPVGTCLSGGLDSSIIVATAAPLLDRPLRAFTVGYAEAAFDERAHARAVAAAAGAEIFEAEPDGGDLLAVLERLVWHQEEPAAGPGLYSQWHVMRLAHEHGMKVLLDGQGGDELLAGYHRYAFPYLRDLWLKGRLTEFTRDVWAVGARQGHAETWAKVFAPWLPRALFQWGRRTLGQGKERVVHPDLERAAGRCEPRAPRAFGGQLSDVLGWEMTARFLPSLLRYEDRNSMAHSIETRLPFLDYRLAEYVFSLPREWRTRGTTTKWILRRALGARLPRAVGERRDKMGYETPTDRWFRGPYAGLLRDLLLAPDAATRDYLEPRALARELEAYLAGRRDIGLQVWRWLHLELWLRAFVAGRPWKPEERA